MAAMAAFRDGMGKRGASRKAEELIDEDFMADWGETFDDEDDLIDVGPQSILLLDKHALAAHRRYTEQARSPVSAADLHADAHEDGIPRRGRSMSKLSKIFSGRSKSHKSVTPRFKNSGTEGGMERARTDTKKRGAETSSPVTTSSLDSIVNDANVDAFATLRASSFARESSRTVDFSVGSCRQSNPMIHGFQNARIPQFVAENLELVKFGGRAWHRDIFSLYTNAIRLETQDVITIVTLMSSKLELLSDRDIKLLFAWVKIFSSLVKAWQSVVQTAIMPWLSEVSVSDSEERVAELFGAIAESIKVVRSCEPSFSNYNEEDAFGTLVVTVFDMVECVLETIRVLEDDVAKEISYHMCIEDKSECDAAVRAQIVSGKQIAHLMIPFLTRWMSSEQEDVFLNEILRSKLDRTRYAMWKSSFERQHLSITPRFVNKYTRS